MSAMETKRTGQSSLGLMASHDLYEVRPREGKDAIFALARTNLVKVVTGHQPKAALSRTFGFHSAHLSTILRRSKVYFCYFFETSMRSLLFVRLCNLLVSR